MGAAGLYLQVYQYLVRFGIQGREQFVKTLSYQKIAQESPDAAQSLLRQFDEARAEDALERLVRLPQDSPLGSLEVLRSITVPTLVMASKQDLIHPVAYGRTIAGLIPYAIYEEVSSQSVDKEKHTAEVRQAIITFLQQQ
jgi:pimeloyl-ACP methyl ester carboxylesterase